MTTIVGATTAPNLSATPTVDTGGADGPAAVAPSAPFAPQGTINRFWAKVDLSEPDGCWPWFGSRNAHGGYGTFSLGKAGDYRTVYAHRFAWEMQNGPIPEGLHVLHHCDNPPCVNLRCLFLGSHQDNMADKIAKGRQSGPKTRPAFHPRQKLTPERVRVIRAKRAEGVACRLLASEFGVTTETVYSVVNRHTWADVA